jgi:hypothetical protein
MLLLQGMGVGVFWITCVRADALQKNYRCVMVQGATRGNPSSDILSQILDHYKPHLVNPDGEELPSLARKAIKYFNNDD